MTRQPFFLSAGAFESFYAGQSTLVLESQASERAGRQDGFCIVCKKHKPDAELYPQIAPGRIHFCPRRFCETCVVVTDEWRYDPGPVSFVGGGGRYAQYPVCCPLCTRRGWQKVCPLLGPENPLWQGRPPAQKDRVRMLRYKLWEAKVQKDTDHKVRTKGAENDDGSMSSDVQILQNIKTGFLKPGVEFVTATAGDVIEKHSWDKRPSQAFKFDTFIIFQIAMNYMIEDIEPDMIENKDYRINFGGLDTQPNKRSMSKASRAQAGRQESVPDHMMMPGYNGYSRFRLPSTNSLPDPRSVALLPEPPSHYSFGHRLRPSLNTSNIGFMFQNDSRRPSQISLSATTYTEDELRTPSDTSPTLLRRSGLGSFQDEDFASKSLSHRYLRELPPNILPWQSSSLSSPRPGSKRAREPSASEGCPKKSPRSCGQSSVQHEGAASAAESVTSRNLDSLFAACESEASESRNVDLDAWNPSARPGSRSSTVALSPHTMPEKRHQRNKPQLRLNDASNASTPAQQANKPLTPLATPSSETSSSFTAASGNARDASISPESNAMLVELKQENSMLVNENVRLKTEMVSLQNGLSKARQNSEASVLSASDLHEQISTLKAENHDLRVDTAILGFELSRRSKIKDDADEETVARRLRGKSGRVTDETIGRLMSNEAFRGLFEKLA